MLALRNLSRRKVRSLFAILQIAVAIAAYVSIVGVTQGLRAQFYRLSQVFAFDLIIQPEGSASPIFSVVSRQEAAEIAKVDGVEAVSLMGIHFMRVPNLSQPIGLMALDPGSELMDRYAVVAGRPLTDDDSYHLIVGHLMADDLGIDTSTLIPVEQGGGLSGPAPVLEFEGGAKYEVVGIFRPPVDDMPFLSGQAIFTLRHYEQAYRLLPRIAAAHVARGRRATTPDEVREALDRCLQVAPRIAEAVPRLRGKTVEQFLDTFKQVELIDRFALAISFLAALVSAIGVANTMLMSVFDRTREIGLLRAIGWSRGRIVSLVELEGVLLAFFGGLAGLPLGLGLVQASKLLIQLGWLDVRIDPVLYGQAVLFALLIGLFGSLYPAWRAANLQPTEALRYE